MSRERRRRKHAGAALGHLTDGREVARHLHEALGGRACWVFLTDNAEGHLHLCTLAAALLALGAGEGMKFGTTDFVNAPTLHRGTVSFLTVPKEVLPPAEVAAWLTGLGLEHEGPAGGKDVVMLAASRDRSELLAVFALAMHRGACQAGGVGEN
jgi:hypothetical protein